jgi:hypothetical protein
MFSKCGWSLIAITYNDFKFDFNLPLRIINIMKIC